MARQYGALHFKTLAGVPQCSWTKYVTFALPFS